MAARRRLEAGEREELEGVVDEQPSERQGEVEVVEVVEEEEGVVEAEERRPHKAGSRRPLERQG